MLKLFLLNTNLTIINQLQCVNTLAIDMANTANEKKYMSANKNSKIEKKESSRHEEFIGNENLIIFHLSSNNLSFPANGFVYSI